MTLVRVVEASSVPFAVARFATEFEADAPTALAEMELLVPPSMSALAMSVIKLMTPTVALPLKPLVAVICVAPVTFIVPLAVPLADAELPID